MEEGSIPAASNYILLEPAILTSLVSAFSDIEQKNKAGFTMQLGR